MKLFVALFCGYTFILHAQIRSVCNLPGFPEVSGSALINQEFWILSDGGSPARIYKIDTITGKPSDSTTFANVSNIDWEELQVNTTHVFVGDFGNNNGTRKNLRIFRFPITDLGKKNILCDTISFHYPEQSDFNSNPLTIYDCEAFIALEDSILLFSKSLADAVCRTYSLPLKKGSYPARLLDTLQLNFWVTGASVYKDIIALCGYGFNGELTPQFRMGYFQNGRMVRTGSIQEKLKYTGPLQVESCVLEGLNLFFTAEKSTGFEAAFMGLNLAKSLRNYTEFHNRSRHFPNPANNQFQIEAGEYWLGGKFSITDINGRLVSQSEILMEIITVDTLKITPGTYFYELQKNERSVRKKFVVE